jgi:SAM-dependent methyltransferase
MKTSKLIVKLKRLLYWILKPILPDPGNILSSRIYSEYQRALNTNKRGNFDCIYLPNHYGHGMPERVVEILLASLSYQRHIKVLDIGHANAMKCHLDMIQTLPEPRDITGVDIAIPEYKVNKYYHSSIVGDISQSSFKEHSFDLIWCISTIEHLGMDNSGYTNNFLKEKGIVNKALKEMLRILKPGGDILITVPFGRFEDHGWQINYDYEHLQNILEIFKPSAAVKMLFFRHTNGQGWYQCVPEELQYVGYYDQLNRGAGGMAAAFITKFI